MQEEPSKLKKLLESIREEKSSSRHLWKVRLLFLLPFIIAAAVFLLLSLK